ncbi:Ig-like domain-containing protein [Enterobacter ludwigii]
MSATISEQIERLNALQSTVVEPATAITKSNGLANTTITSTLAGDTTINGSSTCITVQFVADPSTISIAAGSLRFISDNAAANGTTTNGVKVRVTDAHGNPLAGITITFSADKRPARSVWL